MSEKIKADINAAKQTICSAISDWTQTEYRYGDPIPTIVNGRFTGELKHSLITRNERIAKIVRPVILTTPSTNKELKTLKKMIDHCKVSIKDIEHLTDGIRSKVGKIANNQAKFAPSETVMQEKIIATIGTIQAADIALRRICIASEEVIFESQLEPVNTRGRPKDEVAHKVAYEFSRLYFDITQELPTYADGASGPSGKISPRLTELFEKLAIKADIRRPLTAAIKQIKSENDELT
jgi:hypothetical protein